MKTRLSRAALPFLVLVSATTLLASPPPAFAAKKTAPAAKPSIMGTPAQLVEDLRAAGFDLASMRVVKPELLKKALKTTSGTRDVWTISNAELYTDHESGELELIHYYYYREKRAVADEESSLYPMNSLSSGLIGGENALYRRYGKPHREITNDSYTSYGYSVLFRQRNTVLWRCSFAFNDEGQVWFTARTMGKNFKELKVQRDGSSVSFQGARSALYSDLAQMGFAPGMACTKPEVLARGATDPSSPRTKRFADCSVFVDSDDRIRLFLLFEHKGDLLSSIIRAFMDFTGGLEPWPSGEFGKTLRLGKSAVMSRYGAPDNLSTDSSTIYYYVLLRDGDRLVPVKLSFQFIEHMGSSDNMAVGKVIINEYYLMPSL